MTINIVCTSKPCDGLLFYSYEYCSLLNDRGIPARLVIIPHRKFKRQDYLKTISSKYIHCKNIEFCNFKPEQDDISLVMGRSMITLAFKDFKSYSEDAKNTLYQLFGKKIIAVYSENHPVEYWDALKHFNPDQIFDLCDNEVYPNGEGLHFEKRINFNIYKPHFSNQQFKYLFLGTNEKYYESVEKYLWLYQDHGILVYDDKYINPSFNNVEVPIDNLMGLFDTFVYTKSTFDPAPRIIQECKYFGKNLIYSRDPSIVDGGSVYWMRDIAPPDISPILSGINSLKPRTWSEKIYSFIGRSL